MTKNKKALQHTIAWAIQNIFNANQEAMKILEDKELTEEQKIVKLRSPFGPDYWLVNCILLLKPLEDIAKEEFPEQEQFFKWFDEKWAYIEENKLLKDKCGCKGCKE